MIFAMETENKNNEFPHWKRPPKDDLPMSIMSNLGKGLKAFWDLATLPFYSAEAELITRNKMQYKRLVCL